MCGRAGWLALFLLLGLPARSDTLRLVSAFDHTSASAGGNGDSCLPVLSADGRYVLFASSANNLTLSSNGFPIPSAVPAWFNVYLRDRSNLTTTLISVSTNGIAGGNGNSVPSAFSTNGQFVLFESSANNLVVGDTNNTTDIFLRDLVNEQTWLVSASTNGSVANGSSRSAVMTPDARYVAFVSEASNLNPNDTNKIADVFVRDTQTLATTLISVGAVSANPTPVFPAGSSESPQISVDGRYVAFFSTATNLVPGVRTAGDIYVHDRMAGTNIWASSGMRAQLQAVSGKTNGVCYNLALSRDGKFVAYQASVSPLGAGVNTGIILRYALDTGNTDLVCTNAASAVPLPEETRTLDVTPDGSMIAFVANSNGVQAITTCAQVWNASSGVTTLVSGDLSDAVTPGSLSTRPVMDATGRYVAFISTATNLVTNSLAGLWHVYVRDLLTATTVLVDADTNGVGSSVTASTVPSLSADGNFAAFESADGGLIANDGNRNLDVFVRDVVAGTNELVSTRHSSLASISPNGPSLLPAFASSADGRFIAFASEADNLVAGDTNGFRDVFVRDLASNSVVLVSSDPDGIAGNSLSTEPAISGNGRYVTFTSTATNLVAGDTNKLTDVFVRDLWTGATTLASLNSSGSGSANSNSYSPSLSTDGRWLLFRSQAKDLVNDSFSGADNLFVRDMQSATTVALTTRGLSTSDATPYRMTPDGHFVAFIGYMPGVPAPPLLYVWNNLLAARVFTNTSGVGYSGFSDDGNLIAVSTLNEMRIIDRAASTNWLVTPIAASTRPQSRFSADGKSLTYARYVAPWYQVFLYDIPNRTEYLVSHATNSVLNGGGNSDSPDLTPDGRFVVYRTLATNIVASANGITRQIILYDRQTGLNTLVSANRFTGLPSDDNSLRTRFSLDGQTLLIQSWASDLVAGDFNQSSDIIAQPIFVAVILPSSAGQGPWLQWPFVPGKNYTVQFKHNLGDPAWQTLPGNYTNSGVKAWMQDLGPVNSQRFYRIQAD